MLSVQSCCRFKAQVNQSEWTAPPYPRWKNPLVSLLACGKSFHRFVTVKPGFHRIATIAAIAEKTKTKTKTNKQKKNNRWDGTFSIVVSAIRDAIAEPFFFHSDHSNHSDRSDHMETRLKRQKCLYYTYRRSFFGSKMHVFPLRVGC